MKDLIVELWNQSDKNLKKFNELVSNKINYKQTLLNSYNVLKYHGIDAGEKPNPEIYLDLTVGQFLDFNGKPVRISKMNADQPFIEFLSEEGYKKVVRGTSIIECPIETENIQN